jgi:hypothetical protein
MARRAPLAAICILSAALLPGWGCPGHVSGPGGTTKGSFSATAEMKQVDPGTVKFEPPGRTVKGTVWKGSFTADPNASARKAAKQMGLKLGSGKVVGKYDGKEDYSIGKASATGFQLITFKDKPTGRICVKVAYSSTDHGETYTGTFKSVGGTGRLAKVKASGTMTAKNENPGSPGPGKVSGKGSASKLEKPDGLPAACKALKSI